MWDYVSLCFIASDMAIPGAFNLLKFVCVVNLHLKPRVTWRIMFRSRFVLFKPCDPSNSIEEL